MGFPWFRLYVEVVEDPKVQNLTPALFRIWVNLLCIARKHHDGVLPSVKDLAFTLRTSEGKVRGALKNLLAAKLLDQTEAGLTPHNWSGRQYESDSSTERVRRLRERRRNANGNVSSNVSETVPETETEGDQEAAAEGGGRHPTTEIMWHGIKATPAEFRLLNDVIHLTQRSYWNKSDLAKIKEWHARHDDGAIKRGIQTEMLKRSARGDQAEPDSLACFDDSIAEADRARRFSIAKPQSSSGQR